MKVHELIDQLRELVRERLDVAWYDVVDRHGHDVDFVSHEAATREVSIEPAPIRYDDDERP